MITRRLVLATGLALPSFTPTRGQSTIALRVQHFLGTASPVHRALDKMAGDLRTATNGRVAIQVLPGGAVVQATETLDAVRNGILDGHYSAPSWFAAKDPGFVVLGDTGASFDRVNDRDGWFAESGGGTDLGRALYDRFGCYYVGQVYWPSEHIPSRRAVRGVEDMRGLKIRCPPGMIAEVLGRAGASVINLPTAELFNALQSGVVDAADFANPAFNLEAGLYRAAPFSINASHSMPTCEVSFGKRRWDGLPEEVRSAISTHVATMSRELRATIEADDARAIETMRGQNITVIDWPREEVAKLRDITSQVQETYAARGPDARRILDSLKAYQRRRGVG